MNINKKSWHHDLFTLGDRNKSESTSNVCKYIRGVLAGVFLATAGTLIAVALSLIFLDPILSILAYWITDISFISFFGVVFGDNITLITGSIAYFVILVIIAVFGAVTGFIASKEKLTPVYQDTKFSSFNDVMIAKVKSNHDKICRNINIIG